MKRHSCRMYWEKEHGTVKEVILSFADGTELTAKPENCQFDYEHERIQVTFPKQFKNGIFRHAFPMDDLLIMMASDKKWSWFQYLHSKELE